MTKRDKRPDRIATSGGRQPLTANPFLALAAEGVMARPEGEDQDAPGTSPVASPVDGPCFMFQRTRKGGFPVFLEKRPNGKTVTVIRNLSGDLEGLLSVLKRQCGAGGAVRDGAIEIQGDHRRRVEAFLANARP